MKTIAYLIAYTLTAILSASAADVDVRLLRFTGELPAPDLIRLINSDSMPVLRSFSAVVDAEGGFSYRALTPVAYPTEWDSTGKWLSVENRDTGVLFSGQAKPSESSYILDFQFRLVEFTGTGVYRTDKDAVVAQPIFQPNDLKTKVTVQADEWSLLALRDDRESHLALLIRMRK